MNETGEIWYDTEDEFDNDDDADIFYDAEPFNKRLAIANKSSISSKKIQKKH